MLALDKQKMCNQSGNSPLDILLSEIRACRVCEPELPLGARPIIRARETARILIVGQAPGVRVHETGIPWNDPSGDRLREWMGLPKEAFYDETRVAIMPMGLCYPGRNARGGDLPPRPECMPRWADAVLALLPNIEFFVLAGMYAQRRYLGEKVKRTLTETVQCWREYAPRYIPLPHPSFRNNRWIKQHPWFTSEVVPYLQERIADLM